MQVGRLKETEIQIKNIRVLAMAVENGQEGDTNTQEASSSKSQVEEEATSSSKNEEQQKSKPEDKVSFYKLFAFADGFDILLMILGTIGAVGNGLGLPLMTVLFGQMINSFGNNQNNKDVVEVVSKVKKYIIFYFILYSSKDDT